MRLGKTLTVCKKVPVLAALDLLPRESAMLVLLSAGKAE